MKILKNKHPYYQIIYEWILFITEIFHNFLINFLIKIFEIIKVRLYINNRIFIICNKYYIQLHLTIMCISNWIEWGRNEKQASYNAHSIYKFIYRSFRNGWNIEFTESLIIIFIYITNSNVCIFEEIYHILQGLYRFCDLFCNNDIDFERSFKASGNWGEFDDLHYKIRWRIIEDRRKILDKKSDGRGNRKFVKWCKNEKRWCLID